jgi:hypothetical protein
MISLTQIQRMIDHGSFAQLIRRILSNGRCTCPAIREHLLGNPTGPDTPLAACGLALQRCCELSYLPTNVARRLGDRLAAAQMPDGRFGIADDTALATTAIAVRGLIDYRDQESIGCKECVAVNLDAAIDRGLRAITHMVNSAAGTRDHAIGILIAIWQLGHLSAFRARIDVERVLSRLCEQHSRDLDARLVDYAYAQAA